MMPRLLVLSPHLCCLGLPLVVPSGLLLPLQPKTKEGEGKVPASVPSCLSSGGISFKKSPACALIYHLIGQNYVTWLSEIMGRLEMSTWALASSEEASKGYENSVLDWL